MTTAATALSGDPIAQTPAPAAPNGEAAPVSAPAAVVPAAPAANDWYAGITDEGIRTWATAKGWKDPIGAVESAYNLEKLVGFDKAGRTIVLPKDDASAEEVKAFHTKLGVPESPDGYKLPVPQGMPETFAKQAASWFHEAGVPPKTAEKIAAKWNEHMAGLSKEQETQWAATSSSEYDAWAGEQGAALAQQLEITKRAINQFLPAPEGGKPIDTFTKIENAVGTKLAMQIFNKIGEGLAEHKVHVDGQGQGLVMTPAQAKQRIEVLKSDKQWTSAYLSGDKAKKDEMTRLIALANPVEA